MARPTIWERLRSCFSFFWHANSLSWPGGTRSIAVKMLAMGTLLIIIQLGLSAAMAHKLLAIGSEAECWEVDDTRKLIGGSATDGRFNLTLKKLPLTYINMDRAARKERARGPIFLNVQGPEAYGGLGAVIVGLILNPLMILVMLTWSLTRFVLLRLPHMHRTVMYLAVVVLFYFGAHTAIMHLFNTLPGTKAYARYPWCWQTDDTIRALENDGWWGRSIVLGTGGMAGIGISCMLCLFVVTLVAALRARREAAEQHVHLADLSGLATRREARSPASVAPQPSAAEAAPQAQPVPDSSPLRARDAARPKTTPPQGEQQGRPTEEDEDPFSDPRNVV